MVRRITAFLLCFSLHAATAATAGADTPYMGGGHTYSRSHTATPAHMTEYAVNTLRHAGAGQLEEHILSYAPNEGLRPVVVGPDYIYNGSLTIDEAAQRLEQMGADVVGGINGSFFLPSHNNTPTGVQVRQGVLTSYNRRNQGVPAVGFTYEGDVLLGDAGFSITVSDGERAVLVDRLNYTRNPDLVYMYTSDFSETTRTTQDGTHVVIRADGRLRPGGTLTGTVTQVLTGKTAYAIAEDEFVLSATGSAVERIDYLTEGDEVTISVGCADPRWLEVNAAVSGGNFLVRDGISAGASDGARAPRTAVGVRADGSAVFYTVDGRQSGYSTGLTLNETAQRLIDMGCVTAVELDGGGSTAMSVRMPGEQKVKLVSKPSDGRQRRCADYIMLCNVFPQSDGAAARLFPQPAYVTMMPNAAFTFPGMLATDDVYRAVNTPPGWQNQVRSHSGNPLAGITDGAVFTALGPGDASVNFSLGSAVGTANVHVTSRLDSLTLDSGPVAVKPGESVRLTASGKLNGWDVVSSALSFEWSAEGEIGTVTADGVFTASDEPGKAGSVTVTGGGQSVTLPVTILYPDAPDIGAASSWGRVHINEAAYKEWLIPELQNDYKTPINRKEFVHLAMSWLRYHTGLTDGELVERYAVEPDRTFTDVDGDPVIIAAGKLDVTAGPGGGLFAPDATFNRQDAAVMLVKVHYILNQAGGDFDTLTPPAYGWGDLEDASSYAHSAINFVGSNDVMSGSGNSFNPRETFSREHSITVFNKMG